MGECAVSEKMSGLRQNCMEGKRADLPVLYFSAVSGKTACMQKMRQGNME